MKHLFNFAFGAVCLAAASFSHAQGTACRTPIECETQQRAASADLMARNARISNSTPVQRPELDTSMYQQIGTETANKVAAETHRQ